MDSAPRPCATCGCDKRRMPNTGRLVCDPCNRARANAYRQANLALVQAKDRARVMAMPAEVKRAKHKAWRDSNLDHVRETGRQIMRSLYEANPDKFRERRRVQYWDNPEKSRATTQLWRMANYQKVLDYAKRYRIANLDKCKEQKRVWAAANPARVRQHKKRAVTALSDSYVRTALGLVKRSADKRLISLKREQLMFCRAYKQLNAAIKEVQK